MQNTVSLNKNDPLLSISLLTANRPDTISKCLDSLTSLRESVPSELIIVDTGCSQEMLNILKKYTDLIIPFQWNNDFSAARNAQLSACRGKWFLFIDDDEWFEDTTEIEDFFLSGKYKEYDFCNYIQRNYHDMSSIRYSDDYVTRMARISEILHFESCIHEYMVSDSVKTYSLNSYVHHYGYVYKSEADKYNHYQRNISLLLKMLDKEPDNIRWYIHTVQEYWAVQQYSMVIDFSSTALRHFESSKDYGIYANLGTLYMAVIEAYFNTYNYTKAIDAAKKALQDDRLLPLAVASINEAITRSYAMMDDYNSAYPYATTYLNHYKKYSGDISILSTQSGFLLDETFSKQYFEEVCWIIIQRAINHHDLSMLKEYFDKIDFTNDILFTFDPDIIENIVRFMADSDFDPWYVKAAELLIRRGDHTEKIVALIQEYEKECDTYFLRLARIFSQIEFITPYIAYLKVLSFSKQYSETLKNEDDTAVLDNLLKYICTYSDDYLLYKEIFWNILLEKKVDISYIFENTNYLTWQRAVDIFCQRYALPHTDNNGD